MATVLHVSEFTKGGIETHLNELIKYQSIKYEVFVMASEQNTNRDTLRISHDRLFLYPYKRNPKYFLSAVRAINRKVKELQPDIIHIHGTFAGLFLRTPFFLQKERPAVIYCSHGWAFLMDTSSWKKRIYAWVEKVLSLQTDYIIHISDFEYQRAATYGISPKKSVVVYNGVSNPSSLEREPFEVREDAINLLYVGRFDRQKGFDRLLDVFKENRFENVNLYLVGDTVLKETQYELPDNVIKIGWVNNSEVDRYFEACDAVIVPSRWEGFGIVAIEAFRNKKPVIASNRGALPEIVQHGVTGYIFDFDRKQELVEIIGKLDKNRLRAMGETGEKIFYKKFHSTNMNAQIERLYKSVLKERKDLYAATVKRYV